MSSANKDSFLSSFKVHRCFISFSCLVALARTSRTLLNISVGRTGYGGVHCSPRSQELEEGGLGFFANLGYMVVQVQTRLVSTILTLKINDNTNTNTGEKGILAMLLILGWGVFLH